MEKSSNNKIINQKAFGMIEVLVSLAIASIVLLTFTSLNVYNIKVSRANITKLKASMYLQELIEAAKDLEQSDWDAIVNSPCSTACHPQIQGDAWVLVSGDESLDNNTYTRSVKFEEVHRDQLAFPNIIVDSGGVIDPNTKKSIAEISWNDGFQDRTLTLETYVYKY